jgi:tripeptide aminopeptidase
MDTVPLAAPVEVANDEGVLHNRNEAILGADNKAAVAAILGVARRAAREGLPAGVEVLFTTCEEIGLVGAKAFDRSKLTADHGFVFDHASPLGELIAAAPTYYRIEARFHGHAAHAGIRPESGHNAIAAAARAIDRIEFGRLDEQTTANVGLISGGSARNIVPERCTIEMEARSVDPERIGPLVSEMVDAVTEAASDFKCDVETDVAEVSRGYRLPRSQAPVAVACRGREEMGIEPVLRSTGGGSDANVFQARGLPCLNLADGSERNHQPDERITVDALERLLDVALGLVARSA